MSESDTTRYNLMRPINEVGIVGYGAYLPQYRLPGSEVARVWTNGTGGSPVTEKAVAGLDEDVTTMSIEAARNAIARAGVSPQQLRAVWVGSESHPYAVKPTSTIVAEALGASPSIQAADWEFACKAGTEAVQASIGLIGSGMGKYTLSIGMDTAQGRPRRPARIHGGQRRRGVFARTSGRGVRHFPSQLLLRNRYPRFLAARRPNLPQPCGSLHWRALLFRPYTLSRLGVDERTRHAARRL